MKKLLYFLLAIVVIVCLAVGAVLFFLDGIVKTSINKYASEAVGVPVSVADVSIKPFSGHFAVNGLKIGNPTDFKSPDLLSLDNIAVDVDMKSLLSKKIVIKSIEVTKPEITYEMLSLKQNNISDVIRILKAKSAQEDSEPKTEEAAESKPSDISVVIDMVKVASGTIDAVMNVSGHTNSVAVDMPSITLNNIGGEKPQTLSDGLMEIFTTVLQKAMQTVVNANVTDLKQIADDNMNGIVDKVKEKIGLFGLFGKKEETEE